MWWQRCSTKQHDVCVAWRVVRVGQGIAVKPVYTGEDTAGFEGELPGFFPYTRGPKATM